MKAENLDDILGGALEAAGVYRSADITAAKISLQDWTSFLKTYKTQHHRGVLLLPCSSLKPGQILIL